jgi:hypothetical protein
MDKLAVEAGAKARETNSDALEGAAPKGRRLDQSADLKR